MTSTSAATRSPLRALVVSVRPKQWIKNLLVFAAPGAAGVLGQPRMIGDALVAFACCCLVSSATYLVNDIGDLHADRLHPTKCTRPLAAGELSVGQAGAVAVVLAIVGIGAGAFIHWQLSLALLAYIAVSVAYSVVLKFVAVVDIVTVAAGFVLRAIAGASATHLPISNWFFIVTSFGSLLIVAGKRSAESRSLGSASRTRSTLADYSPAFLEQLRSITTAVVLVAYCLWAFEKATASHDHVAWFEFSIVPFTLTVLRYAELLDSGEGEAPEDIALSDRSLQAFAALWAVVFALGIYLR